MDNYQVEDFRDKDERDRRFQDLRYRKNDDGTIGRRGLVKFSSVEEIEPALVKRLKSAKIGKVRTVLVQRAEYNATWSIAYPRMLPKPGYRKKERTIPTGPSPKRHRRLERFRKRHPLWNKKCSTLHNQG
jgi:hypothetical protein